MANFEDSFSDDLKLFTCLAIIYKHGNMDLEVAEAIQPAEATTFRCVQKSRVSETWRMNIWDVDARGAYDLFHAYCGVALAEHEWMPQPRKSLPEEDIFG